MRKSGVVYSANLVARVLDGTLDSLAGIDILRAYVN